MIFEYLCVRKYEYPSRGNRFLWEMATLRQVIRFLVGTGECDEMEERKRERERRRRKGEGEGEKERKNKRPRKICLPHEILIKEGAIWFRWWDRKREREKDCVTIIRSFSTVRETIRKYILLGKGTHSIMPRSEKLYFLCLETWGKNKLKKNIKKIDLSLRIYRSEANTCINPKQKEEEKKNKRKNKKRTRYCISLRNKSPTGWKSFPKHVS